MRIMALLLPGLLFGSLAHAVAFYDSSAQKALLLINEFGMLPASEKLGFKIDDKGEKVSTFVCNRITREELESATLSRSNLCRYSDSLSERELGWRLPKLREALHKPAVELSQYDGQAMDMNELEEARNAIALWQAQPAFREAIQHDSPVTVFARYKANGAPFAENIWKLPKLTASMIVDTPGTKLEEMINEISLLKVSGRQFGNFDESQSVLREEISFRKEAVRFAKEQPVSKMRATFDVEDCDVDVVAGNFTGSFGKHNPDDVFELYKSDSLVVSFKVEKLGKLPNCTTPRKRVISTNWVNVELESPYLIVDYPGSANIEVQGWQWRKRPNAQP